MSNLLGRSVFILSSIGLLTIGVCLAANGMQDNKDSNIVKQTKIVSGFTIGGIGFVGVLGVLESADKKRRQDQIDRHNNAEFERNFQKYGWDLFHINPSHIGGKRGND